MVAMPRLVIAAPASGAGKTTVAIGLMAALRARGMTVSPHKVGPDYIDPGYHALASGRPGRNLDPWLVGEELVAPLFLHGTAGHGPGGIEGAGDSTAADADIAVVEGVMGLYDGAAGQGDFASTAHVARLLDAPVVLVVDVARQGRSVAALVHGFASYDTRIRIGGVILNRTGSYRHEWICREALSESGIPVLGAIPRSDEADDRGGSTVPSRHLGLIPAAERSAEAIHTVERLGAIVTASCDLDALVRLARSARPLTATPWNPADALTTTSEYDQYTASGITRVADDRPTPDGSPQSAVAGGPGSELNDRPTPGRSPWGAGDQSLNDRPTPDGGPQAAVAGGLASELNDRTAPGGRPRIAVAGGLAFTFGYAEQAELLAAAGAEVVVFDPLRDEALPEGTAGLIIGGGFPEVYAAELAANRPLLRQVASFAGPIAAECAGLLYLGRELDGLPMCGVLDLKARMTPTLTLGYRDAVAVSGSVLTREGERYRGHEFHRTTVEPAHGSPPVFRWRDGPDGAHGADGFGTSKVLGTYLHLHWAGSPHLAARFVGACR